MRVTRFVKKKKKTHLMLEDCEVGKDEEAVWL